MQSAQAPVSSTKNVNALPFNQYAGMVEAHAQYGLKGWATKASIPDAPVTLEVFLNADLCAVIKPNLPLDLVIAKEASSALHRQKCFAGFALPWRLIQLPEQGKYEECSVTVRIAGTKIKLNGVEPLSFKLKDLHSWAEAQRMAMLGYPTLKERNLSGNFENLAGDGSSVSGWVASPDEAAAIELAIFVNGREVAKAVPDIIRPDLIDRYGTRATGFNVSIEAEHFDKVVSTVAVVANGGVLPGSVKTIDFSPSLRLAIDSIQNGVLKSTLTGWKGGDIEGTIFVDGEEDGTTVFSLDEAGVATSNYKVKNLKSDGQKHVYQIKVAGLASDPALLSWPDYRVSLDIVSFDKLVGWVATSMSDSLTLGLYHQGKRIAKTKANIARVDVKNALGLSSDKCGFSFDLDFRAESSLTLSIKDEVSKVELAVVDLIHKYQASIAHSHQFANANGNNAFSRIMLAHWVSGQDGGSVHSARYLPPQVTKEYHKGVSVIVPIYGGAVETVECLESVFKSKNNTPYRIFLINDSSPEPLIHRYLENIEKRNLAHVTVITRKTNKGFSEAVNVGILAAGNDDVILLNADTVVSDHWVDKIVDAGQNNPLVGTLTPLSNNGELATVPYICKTLPIKSQQVAALLDKTAGETNPGAITDMPVGIGFCMFISRNCLSEVGLFDAAKWGRGYGEEVDFCLKAAALGWRNVLLHDTFVVHRGNVSFGNEKLQRVLESAKKISQMYPFYDANIQRYLEQDPIRPYRRMLNVNLIRQGIKAPLVLQVTHAFGGGTEAYVDDMVTLQKEDGNYSVVLKLDAKGNASLHFDMTKHPLSDIFEEEHVERFSRTEKATLLKVIKALGFTEMHLHAVFGMDSELLSSLTRLIPFDVTVHDYAWLCPRVTLTRGDAQMCSTSKKVPAKNCGYCLQLFGEHPGLTTLLSDNKDEVAEYRKATFKVLAAAKTVYVGAADVMQRLAENGVKANFKVVPHPAPASSVFWAVKSSVTPPETTLKVAILGAISDIKGFYELEKLANYCAKKKLPIEFQVFGYTMQDDALRSLPCVKLIGSYKEENLDALIEEHKPNMALFLNQWPETFSYTLSHAFRLGLWPLVTDIGAPAERVKAYGFGTVIPQKAKEEDVAHAIIEAGAALHKVKEGLTIDYARTLKGYRQ